MYFLCLLCNNQFIWTYLFKFWTANANSFHFLLGSNQWAGKACCNWDWAEHEEPGSCWQAEGGPGRTYWYVKNVFFRAITSYLNHYYMKMNLLQTRQTILLCISNTNIVYCCSRYSTPKWNRRFEMLNASFTETSWFAEEGTRHGKYWVWQKTCHIGE